MPEEEQGAFVYEGKGGKISGVGACGFKDDAELFAETSQGMD